MLLDKENKVTSQEEQVIHNNVHGKHYIYFKYDHMYP